MRYQAVAHGRHQAADAIIAAQFECANAHDLTLDEVHLVQADFVDAAKFLQEQGLDAVEINAAGNNIGQAPSRAISRNEAPDEYGSQS